MNITAVHRAIANAVNGLTLSGNTLRVTATPFMPLMPECPHFYPHSWRIAYDRTFGQPNSLCELTGTWHLALAFSDDEAAHYEATSLAGSGEETIREAILKARGAPGEAALDGAAHDLRLQTASGPTSVDVGETHLLVIEFSLLVIGH